MATQTESFNKMLYSIGDTQEILGGLSRTTIYELAKKNKIDLVKIGSRSFVTQESLELYVTQLTPAK